MSEHFPIPADNHPVDRLVREHLLAEAATVDVDSILVQVKQRAVPAPSRIEHRFHRTAWFASGLAVAASIALIVFFGMPATKIVSAAELITAAQKSQLNGRDRCYELTIEIDTGAIRFLDLPPMVRKSKVWTHGDQFWFETTPPKPETPPLTWGQESTGRVWMAAPNRKFGVVYEPDEVSEPVTNACNMMSLRTATLLSDLLVDYDLTRRDPSQSDQPIRVEAVYRSHSKTRAQNIREVTLELDPATKAILRAVVKRTITAPFGGPQIVTLTFNYIESADLPADQYILAGHVDADAKILDRHENNRGPRTHFREELMKRFGDRIKP